MVKQQGREDIDKVIMKYSVYNQTTVDSQCTTQTAHMIMTYRPSDDYSTGLRGARLCLHRNA